MTTKDKKNWIFISFANEDEFYAKWLHKYLKVVKFPKNISENGRDLSSREKRKVFLANLDLHKDGTDVSEKLYEAIENSENFLLLCSPNAVRSMYVNKEIDHFLKCSSINNLFPVIVGGEPNSREKELELESLQECYPSQITYIYDESGTITPKRTDPLAPDLRGLKKKSYSDESTKRELANLIASIIGVDRSVFYDLEKRREKRKYINIVISSLMLIFALTVTYFSYFHTFSENYESVQTNRDYTNWFGKNRLNGTLKTGELYYQFVFKGMFTRKLLGISHSKSVDHPIYNANYLKHFPLFKVNVEAPILEYPLGCRGAFFDNFLSPYEICSINFRYENSKITGVIAELNNKPIVFDLSNSEEILLSKKGEERNVVATIRTLEQDKKYKHYQWEHLASFWQENDWPSNTFWRVGSFAMGPISDFKPTFEAYVYQGGSVNDSDCEIQVNYFWPHRLQYRRSIDYCFSNGLLQSLGSSKDELPYNAWFTYNNRRLDSIRFISNDVELSEDGEIVATPEGSWFKALDIKANYLKDALYLDFSELNEQRTYQLRISFNQLSLYEKNSLVDAENFHISRDPLSGVHAIVKQGDELLVMTSPSFTLAKMKAGILTEVYETTPYFSYLGRVEDMSKQLPCELDVTEQGGLTQSFNCKGSEIESFHITRNPISDYPEYFEVRYRDKRSICGNRYQNDDVTDEIMQLSKQHSKRSRLPLPGEIGWVVSFYKDSQCGASWPTEQDDGFWYRNALGHSEFAEVYTIGSPKFDNGTPTDVEYWKYGIVQTDIFSEMYSPALPGVCNLVLKKPNLMREFWTCFKNDNDRNLSKTHIFTTFLTENIMVGYIHEDKESMSFFRYKLADYLTAVDIRKNFVEIPVPTTYHFVLGGEAGLTLKSWVKKGDTYEQTYDIWDSFDKLQEYCLLVEPQPGLIKEEHLVCISGEKWIINFDDSIESGHVENYNNKGCIKAKYGFRYFSYCIDLEKIEGLRENKETIIKLDNVIIPFEDGHYYERIRNSSSSKGVDSTISLYDRNGEETNNKLGIHKIESKCTSIPKGTRCLTTYWDKSMEAAKGKEGSHIYEKVMDSSGNIISESQ